jgi:hypothetical protein
VYFPQEIGPCFLAVTRVDVLFKYKHEFGSVFWLSERRSLIFRIQRDVNLRVIRQ